MARRSPLWAAAEWIVRRELLWLALLSPLFVFPNLKWAWALAALPTLWIARRLARGRFVPGTPLDWPIALLLVMALVSLFATPSIEQSLPKVAGLLFGVGIYYALVEWAATAERLRWAVGGFLAGGAALSLVSLLGTDWMGKVQGLAELTSGLPLVVRGLPGAESGFHPNEVGGALLWVTLPAAALMMWTWRSRCARRERAALTFVLLLCAGTLALTQSRAALVGAFGGLLLLLYLLLPRGRAWLASTLLATLVTVAAVVALIGPGMVVDRLLEPRLPRWPTSDPANMRVRLEIWSGAYAAIRDAPLTGAGMNIFRQMFHERYGSPIIPHEHEVAHAHNIFLQAALDLGVPGMLAYVAVWIAAGAMLVRAWRHAADSWSRAAVAGVSAGLAASLIFGMTDAITLGAKPGVFFWASLGIAVLLYQRGRMHPEDDGTMQREA